MIDFNLCIHLRKNGICVINGILCNPDDESMSCEYENREDSQDVLNSKYLPIKEEGEDSNFVEWEEV